MAAPDLLVALLEAFVECFTRPGFGHFRHFVLGLCCSYPGQALCVTETLRATGWHRFKHWTSPYHFMSKARWSCSALSARLLLLLAERLALEPEEALILAIDDTLVRKHGKGLFGLGYYPDPTNKNPGAHKMRSLGHCWVVAALLVPRAGGWRCFPLASLLFVQEKNCSGPESAWPFASKIELAGRLLRRLGAAAGGRPVLVVADNLYAKKELIEKLPPRGALISRLRRNAQFFERPPAPKPGQRGRRPKRGRKVNVPELGRKRSKRQELEVETYGKRRRIEARVARLIPSPTLGDSEIKIVLLPAPPRRGKKGREWMVLFSTDPDMPAERIVELYAARFKIEQCFKELKTSGGFADCRQRSAKALKRHATLCLAAHSLSSLVALEAKDAHLMDAQPWWSPAGPPSPTRVRRTLCQLGSELLRRCLKPEKPTENPLDLAQAA
jgi:SRSO17 transposase